MTLGKKKVREHVIKQVKGLFLHCYASQASLSLSLP